MYITSSKNMLLKAQRQSYVVPAFNIHNLETMQVVAETAVELRFPLILAGILGTYSYAGTGNAVAVARDLAKKQDLPFALHPDHHKNLANITRKVQARIRSVMIDGSHSPFEENATLAKSMVELSHRYDVNVKAELGRLGGVEDDLVVDAKDVLYTNPEQARELVARTGTDPLAITIGTAHGLYTVESKLDLERLAAIRDYVDVPLVPHDASDLPGSDIRRAISLGVRKVGVAAELKIVFSDALKAYSLENLGANDPRHYMKPAKVATKEVVRKVIRAYGCEGQLQSADRRSPIAVHTLMLNTAIGMNIFYDPP